MPSKKCDVTNARISGSKGRVVHAPSHEARPPSSPHLWLSIFGTHCLPYGLNSMHLPGHTMIGLLPLLSAILLIRSSQAQVSVYVNGDVFGLINTDVTLRCRTETKEHVTQLTWQKKKTPNNEDFLTYSKGEKPYSPDWNKRERNQTTYYGDNGEISDGTIHQFQSLIVSDTDIHQPKLYMCETRNIIGSKSGIVYLYKTDSACRLPLVFLVIFVILVIVLSVGLIYLIRERRNNRQLKYHEADDREIEFTQPGDSHDGKDRGWQEAAEGQL
ncbi:nectin-1-like isoform X3 [Pelobates cultripes]|uniref:Nectin-1-like isoform X3 n=1 Tax=Pelobates cultripes TaxID=61616 RepID=A0AAD1QXT5_PELCU|nr:nectin-1-like isoform X3 [Pelobates cultripes]